MIDLSDTLIGTITTPLPPPAGTPFAEYSQIRKSPEVSDADLISLLKTMRFQAVTRTVLGVAATAVNLIEETCCGLDTWAKAMAFPLYMRTVPWSAAVLHPALWAAMRAGLQSTDGGELQTQQTPSPARCPEHRGQLEGLQIYESPHCNHADADTVVSMLLGEGAIGLWVGDWGVEVLEDRIRVGLPYKVDVLDYSRILGIFHPRTP